MTLFPTELWELLSYVVTVIGLPLAIFVFAFEQRKERANEQDAIQQLLSDSYAGFLKLVIENSDLRLMSQHKSPQFSEEQEERVLALYSILISIFERAYIMSYAPGTTGHKARLWRSWEDIMSEWCQREDFRRALPNLLVGEDEDFAGFMRELASRKAPSPRPVLR